MGPDVGQYGPVGACLAIVLAILWPILAQYDYDYDYDYEMYFIETHNKYNVSWNNL